jgi:hypothetical protein
MHSIDSQEVGHNVPVRNRSRAFRDGVENIERSFELLVDVEDGSNVSTSVAVVGCRPHSDEGLVFEPVLEPVHHELMGSGDQLNFVYMVELLGHL